MKTTSRDSHAKKRVRDGTADTAKQTVLRTIGSFGTESNYSASIEDLEHPQREGSLPDTTVEDGINPEDAPEVVWDDTNEGVCAIVS